MKLQARIVFRIYQIIRALRYSLLQTVFGTVSHCKHSPTCGTYFIRQVEQRGVLIGSLKGLWRVLRCW